MAAVATRTIYRRAARSCPWDGAGSDGDEAAFEQPAAGGQQSALHAGMRRDRRPVEGVAVHVRRLHVDDQAGVAGQIITFRHLRDQFRAAGGQRCTRNTLGQISAAEHLPVVWLQAGYRGRLVPVGLCGAVAEVVATDSGRLSFAQAALVPNEGGPVDRRLVRQIGRAR